MHRPSPAPTGLVPILATPFTSDGRLDLPSLRSLVEFQIRCGVDGLAVFGMASEGFALTRAERSVILREVRTIVGPDLPLVAGVNATSTVTAVELAAEAVESGADHLMVLPPYLTVPSSQQIPEFFADVAAEAGAPIMVQDAPGVTGVSIAVEQIVKLATVPEIASVKVEAPPTPVKIADVAAAAPADFAVLGGQNAQDLIEEYDNGAVGTMPACEFSDHLRVILDDLAAGRRADARAGFARLQPLIRLGVRPCQAWAVHKEVLLRRGIINSARVRLPARPLDSVTRTALDEVLAELTMFPQKR
ncbi:dihydrodipicolinate synthase family protein [Mycolicibacterium mageritense]|uniref:dihydrodipicolinate synthase family protein n=1 Tax=Mycolicibacterium mageritense TaxID=53462 RepID=UPI0011D9D4A4|nr:dihydrodipicolinate synthase family protein [Mycolicibacterium mageritense]TXI54992.1 MAG: dihydrodipicolinate synthase family protein [Mycolicibacterium mageritense]